MPRKPPTLADAALQITEATAADGPAIEALLDAGFGVDRRSRTAYRLREGAMPIAALSLVARRADGGLDGSIQYWPIELVGAQPVPLTLLGPVVARVPGQGVGVRLITESLARADALGHTAILLIGDLDYYARFGFSAAATGGWRLPGPFDQHRLLLRQTIARSLPVHADVCPASTVPV